MLYVVLFCMFLLGFSLKHGSSVKSSTQIVTSYEECHRKAVDCRALVHCAARPRFVLVLHIHVLSFSGPASHCRMRSV